MKHFNKMRKVNKKIQDMAVFIEFLVSAGLAIFFHMVLHNEQAAYVMFGMGMLLSLVTYMVREEIEKSRGELLEQYHQAHLIPFALAQVADAECQAKAQELVAATLKNIEWLQQGYIPLDEMDFYLEGGRLADQTVQHIKAVDPVYSGWHNRAALINFYQGNLRAINRGISITRVFVANRSDLADPEVQKVLVGQYRDKIDIRIAFREEFPAAVDISGSDSNSSFDFAIYDDRAVTAVFAHPGKYHGRKTAADAEVAKYLHLYDRLEQSAHPVTLENDRIVPVNELLSLVS